MGRLVKVQVVIEVTIFEEVPVQRAGETQVADFILPALDQLKAETVDVKSIVSSFTSAVIAVQASPSAASGGAA